MQLCIRGDYVTLGEQLIGTTNNALGNFITVLERDFPSDDYTSESFVLNCLHRKRKTVYGLNENGLSVYERRTQARTYFTSG